MFQIPVEQQRLEDELEYTQLLSSKTTGLATHWHRGRTRKVDDYERRESAPDAIVIQ